MFILFIVAIKTFEFSYLYCVEIPREKAALEEEQELEKNMFLPVVDVKEPTTKDWLSFGYIIYIYKAQIKSNLLYFY